jgi:hypothetical protein
MTNKDSWELKAIVKALSTLELINTNDENKRLKIAKASLNKLKTKEKLWNGENG